MRVVDARALPIAQEDVIAVTDASLYYRVRTDEVHFALYRFDKEDGMTTRLHEPDYSDLGPSKLFVSREIVYFLHETPRRDGIVYSELIGFSYRSGKAETIATFEIRGNSHLYWVLDDRYFVFLTTFGETEEAFLYDRVTGRRERIRDERLLGQTGRFRTLSFMTISFADAVYIVCNARLNEFEYVEALESGEVTIDEPIDHSEALLICSMTDVIHAIWNQDERLPFRDILRLHGEGDTVQWLGEREGRLRFAAYVEATNQETIYELASPEEVVRVTEVDWSSYEPMDFLYDDLSSTILIQVDGSETHTEVVDVATGARYIDSEPFERVFLERYLIHEYAEGATLGVTVYDMETTERMRFDDAYYMIRDETIIILSAS